MTIQTEQRQEYQKKVEAELRKMNAQIDEYRAKMDQSTAELSATYHDRMEQLYAQRDAAQRKLEELGRSSDEA